MSCYPGRGDDEINALNTLSAPCAEINEVTRNCLSLTGELGNGPDTVEDLPLTRRAREIVLPSKRVEMPPRGALCCDVA